MRAAGLAGQCWVRVPCRPTSTPSLHQKCKLQQLRDATKLQVGPNALLCRRPRVSLSCGAASTSAVCKLCNSCTSQSKARPKDLGQRIRLGMGPDSAESVRTAMTKTIIREIQLEKLLIQCLFSQSWSLVIRKI